jgi:hypothetical protein
MIEMKKLIYLLSILTLSFAFYGCDWSIGLNGRVLANENGEPISGAQVTLKSINKIVTTDSLGFFYFRATGGGKLPKPIYLISKEGYKDFEIEFSSTNSGSVTIVKTGEKNYDLGGKYFYPDSTNLSTYLVFITFEKYSQDYTKRGDSMIFYMDIDDMEVEFENFLKRRQEGGWNNDRYVIK